MHSRTFKFLTFFVYSPRGTSENAIKSRNLLGICKNGHEDFSLCLATNIEKYNEKSYFENSVLVPVPRNSPIVEGAVYPSRIITEKLVSEGIGIEFSDCLIRTKTIPKSSNNFSAETRNSVETHSESLSVNPILITQPTIIIVDDVLTLGRTAMASAIKIQDQYPDKEVKIFCPFRTRSFKDDNLLLDIRHGEMTLSCNNKVIMPD